MGSISKQLNQFREIKLKFSGMLVLAQNRFKRSGGLGKRQDSFHYETSNGLDLPQQENNVRRHRYRI